MFDCIKREVSDDTCIICTDNSGKMESYSASFSCKCEGNFFHKKCWKEYRKTFNTCPLCRKQADVVVEIRPERVSRSIDETLGYSSNDKMCCTCCYSVFNFSYWCVITAFLAVGLSTIEYELSSVYIISLANGIVALYEIISTLTDCAMCHFGVFFSLLGEGTKKRALYSILVILRFITLILTMVNVSSEGVREVYPCRVAFTMIIVHFTLVGIGVASYAIKNRGC